MEDGIPGAPPEVLVAVPVGMDVGPMGGSKSLLVLTAAPPCGWSCTPQEMRSMRESGERNILEASALMLSHLHVTEKARCLSVERIDRECPSK